MSGWEWLGVEEVGSEKDVQGDHEHLVPGYASLCCLAQVSEFVFEDLNQP